MKTIFRTSVLAVSLLAMCATSLSAIDRGLGDPKSVYIPKGTVAFSLSGGYNQWKATGEDLEQGIILAGIIDEVNGHVNLASAAAGASWFFADNLSLGLRFANDNKDIDVNHLEMLSLVKLSNKHIRRETYSGSLAMRGYLPLFNSRIVAILGFPTMRNETEFVAVKGEGKSALRLRRLFRRG